MLSEAHFEISAVDHLARPSMYIAPSGLAHRWEEFAPFTTSGQQSHDWPLQRAHATLAHKNLAALEIRLLFLDANEFIVLPESTEQGLRSRMASGCLSSGNDIAQITLRAWDIHLNHTQGTLPLAFVLWLCHMLTHWPR
jgi:hypothetical protein